jgi:hypothetical protein
MRLDRLATPNWPVLALLLVAGACALEEGTTPTSNTPPVVASDEGQPAPTAPPADPGAFPPSIVSPAPGSEVSSASPTLTVANATFSGTTTPTYTFQVADDRNFSDVVARQESVPEGSGQTSWQVGKNLDKGRYFWRALAQTGTARLTSATADFTVPEFALPEPGEPGPPTGPGTVIVSDPLTNFASVGAVNGGAFTSGGWEVRGPGNYIRYHVPTLRSGYVQWENRGLQRFNPSRDQFMLFGMWDADRGDYRANPFRVHIQKLDQNHNAPYVRLRWIANGEQHDAGHNFLDWNFTQLYRWRLQWGPSGGGNLVQVFLNGNLLISQGYGPAYGPQRHFVELGIAERAESIVGVRYLNVEIGSR